LRAPAIYGRGFAEFRGLGAWRNWWGGDGLTTLAQIVADYAEALKAVDGTGGAFNAYQPGIGPFSESEGLKLALGYLKETQPTTYQFAGERPYPHSRTRCDLVIPGEWAIEFKMLRPYGDNGKPAEHWSENALHPYLGNTSAVGDCLKLTRSEFAERKSVIIYGFEHNPPEILLEPTIRAFEVIAEQVMGIRLSARHLAHFGGLIHPVFHQGAVYGWEVLAHDSPV
jgi:hypothetical protein